MILSTKVKLLKKIILLPKDEKILFVEAVFFLFFSKVYLFLPFRKCVKSLRQSNGMNGIADPVLLVKIRVAIARANKLAFWKNVCLVKSFAARYMLQRRNIGSTIYLGLQYKNEKELVAHAWLIAEDVFITPKGRTPYKEIFSV